MTYQTWKGYGYKTDESAFVFLVNLKKKYPNVLGTSAIYTSSSSYSCFGTLDIIMTKNLNYINSYFNSFENFVNPYEVNDREKDFKIEELEVFQLVDQE